MIDFHKELEKYDFFALDRQFLQFHSETAQIVEILNTTIRRLGKEVHQANLQLEEVLAHCAGEREQEKLLAEQKKALTACRDEHLSLVRGLLKILDQLEDIYRYSLKNPNGWSAQLRLLWDHTAAALLPHGITRIEGEGAVFDPRLHSAAQVIRDENRPGETIVEVLRCGYIYRARVLRKAQVVVVTNNKEGENHEQDRGY